MVESSLLEALSLDCETDNLSREESGNAIPPPAYLLRLMQEAARRSKVAGGGKELLIESTTSTTTATSTCTESSTSLLLFSSLPSPETSNDSYTSSAGSNLTDVSPRLEPFSNYSGSSSSSSRGSSVNSSSINTVVPAMTSLNLPLATLNPFSSSTTTTTTTNLITSVEGGKEKILSGTMTPASYANKRLEDVYTLPIEIIPEEDLLPPENFAMVASFVYRSSFPKRKNFPFLKSLGLKSVL